MKKSFAFLLAAMVIVTLAGCTKSAETLTGKADGFGGVVTVTVTREGDKITDVKVDAPSETKEIATPAIEQLPAAIVAANSAEVDAVAGCTVTSNAIKYAVNNAINPTEFPYPVEKTEDAAPPAAVTAGSVFHGVGVVNNARLGPGADSTETAVYSFNDVVANVLFDADGKIVSVLVDVVEVATPNYDGAGMPHFAGFPGMGGYKADPNHDTNIVDPVEVTDDAFLADVSAWESKRDRGDTYKMGAGTWAQQMNAFEKSFVGKTVAEVEEWFTKYCSDVNGRPLVDGSTNEQDKAKYDALSDEEKAALAEVTAGATMSIKDAHGDILGAIKEAYDNRRAVELTEAKAIGIGVVNNGRVGPRQDADGVQQYSFNQVYANTVFDAEGKVVALYVDILEVATPNGDHEGSPAFRGFPGQKGYNNNIGGTLSVVEPTEDTFVADVENWLTKRERGDTYVMTGGTWEQQMDAFEKAFVGKTVDEIEEWYKKYCSDVNGRPLVAGSTNEQDKAKYDALTDEEKAALAEVTAGATMSVNDVHGDIIKAIRDSYDDKIAIDVTISK